MVSHSGWQYFLIPATIFRSTPDYIFDFNLLLESFYFFYLFTFCFFFVVIDVVDVNVAHMCVSMLLFYVIWLQTTVTFSIFSFDWHFNFYCHICIRYFINSLSFIIVKNYIIQKKWVKFMKNIQVAPKY